MDGYSKDITIEEIEKLRSVFPQCVVEGKVKIDQLLSILGIYDERDFEKYEFTWKGKNECYKTARERTKATLLPCEDESVNFNDTNNIYIEGDNLEVLKILQQGYYNKIKMIYIDPPYNTGNDFVYKDDYKDSLENYKKIVSSLGKSNPETSGRFHTDWLNMMFPRLMLAHTLLKDDGLIFISIDDNEVFNLKKICDEIFGENNFINIFVWQRNSSAKTEKGKFTVNTEYVLLYAKGTDYKLNSAYKPLSEASQKLFKFDDNDGRGKYQTVSLQKPRDPGPETTYDYIDNNGKIWECPPKGWRMKKDKIKELENDNRLVLTGKSLRVKDYWNERENEGKRIDTLWNDLPQNTAGSSKLENIMGVPNTFDNPKPIDLIKRCLSIGDKDDIILDFFSGSATTAHAVMQLNAEDGGNRKYIMVQLPELCSEKSEAYKAGYKNICEIGKERIRRAGAKIKEEIEEYNKQLKLDEQPKTLPDIGFRVFKLDSSNILKWNIRIIDEEYLREFLENSKELVDGRTQMQAMFEIMIKNGFELTEKIFPLDIDGYKFYYISEDCLVMISFEENIPIEVVEKAIEYAPAKIIFSRKAFKDTSEMVTAKHIISKEFSYAQIEVEFL